MHWMKIRFRLTGSLHVGAGRWGYVRRGRPYLPGWTLWGALTNFCKRNGKFSGSFTEVGEHLDRNFWLGHCWLARDRDDGCTDHYLPSIDDASGTTVYHWQPPLDKSVPDRRQSPLSFRAGVVRGRLDNDPRGRHFLTETIESGWKVPVYLEGWYLAVSTELPLEPGDRLPVGGNRQTGGAVITLMSCGAAAGTPDLNRCSHYRLDENSSTPVAGAVERIVMRRTKEGGGFGRSFINWGLHAAPGWRFTGENSGISPFKKIKDGNDIYYHGTVHSSGAGTHAAS